MHYVVIKPLKSKGIAAILVFLLWPVGMFYSTVYGGLIMSFFVGPLVLLTIDSPIFILLLPIFFLTCLVWAINAVTRHNNRIICEHQQIYNSNQQVIATDLNIIKEQNVLTYKKEQLQKNLEYHKSEYENGGISEMEYLLKKEQLTKQIEILAHNENVLLNSPNIQEINPYLYQEKKGYTETIIIIILSILLLFSLAYLCYRKGWFNNGQAKAEIKIEKQIDEKDRKEEPNQNSRLIKELKESDTFFWKVVAENLQDNDGSWYLKVYEGSLKYAFTKKNVYEIKNERITQKWKRISTEDDIEGTMYNLDKGYKIYTSGFFVLSQDDTFKHSYDIREVDPRLMDFDRLSE